MKDCIQRLLITTSHKEDLAMKTIIRRLVSLLTILCVIVIGTVGLSEGETTNYEPLEKGAKGEAVEKLQERLNDLGYNVGRADGDYGKKTKRAVEDFQRANNLEVTGVADEDTQALLFSDAAATPAPTATPTPKPTKKPSSSSSSNSGEKLLSRQDCIELAEFYLKTRVGSVTIQLRDATMDGNQCLVAIQYSSGYSMNVAGVLIDRRDGSLLYIR